MLQCHADAELRTSIYVPPCEVEYYELGGSTIKTTCDEEGLFFKKSKWGQAFYVIVPMILFSCLMRNWKNLGQSLCCTQGTNQCFLFQCVIS